MEVTPRKAVLLSESAEEVRAIDLARAEEALERARRRLAEGGKDVDRARAESGKERAMNRLRLGRRYRT
jgi:F-type H+-transporting ATPase subunit epsilon